MGATLISAAFFGLNAVASKILYAPAASARFDAVNLLIARGLWTVPLFVVLALVTRPRPMPPLSFSDAALFLLCEVSYGPGTNALSALGASMTSGSHAVLLLSMFPPLAAGLAARFLRERLAPLRIIAITISVIGAATLTLVKSDSGSMPAGDLMIGRFIISWALLTLGIRRLDRTFPALYVVGVFGAIGSSLLGVIGVALGRLDAGIIPLRHFDPQTVIWFDFELVLLLSIGAQLLQGIVLRMLNVAVVVALTSYGAIFFGLAASLAILGERLSIDDAIAGVFLVTALGLSLVPETFFKAVDGKSKP